MADKQNEEGPGKAKDTEIERKFLVPTLPDLEGVKHDPVSQGYLAVDQDGTEVRLRKIGDKHFETVKTGAGLKRGEYETEISGAQYEALWPATAEKRLEKTRYEIAYHHHTLYLDVYHATLEGLKVAEVEFDSEVQSREFAPPAWFGKEITDEASYKNRNLAIHGLPESK